MESLLGQFFMRKRLALGLTRGQLAALAGCKNISKGAKKIYDLEMTGTDDGAFVVKLAVAMGIDDATINQLATQDRQRYVDGWNKWADMPVKPYLVVRIIAAFYRNQDLPENVKTVEQAEAWASARAKELKHRCCLVWSRRLSIYFSDDGSTEGRQVATPDYDPRPSMQIGHKRFLMTSVPQKPEAPK